MNEPEHVARLKEAVALAISARIAAPRAEIPALLDSTVPVDLWPYAADLFAIAVHFAAWAVRGGDDALTEEQRVRAVNFVRRALEETELSTSAPAAPAEQVPDFVPENW